jgi:hypothetical protein
MQRSKSHGFRKFFDLGGPRRSTALERREADIGVNISTSDNSRLVFSSAWNPLLTRSIKPILEKNVQITGPNQGLDGSQAFAFTELGGEHTATPATANRPSIGVPALSSFCSVAMWFDPAAPSGEFSRLGFEASK